MRLIRTWQFAILCCCSCFLAISLWAEEGPSDPALSIQPVKPWAVFCFLNGDGNLRSSIRQNIKDMETVGSTSAFHLVTQWGNGTPRKPGMAKRMLITRNPLGHDWYHTQPISPVLETLDSVNMADWRVLRDFLLWGVAHFPAEHYMIILSGHGSGWKLPQTKGLLPDRGRVLALPDLAKALEAVRQKTGKQIDILGMDACLMATVEVLSEVQEQVRYLLASEEVIPSIGWPYGAWLSTWEHASQSFRSPHAAPPAEQIGKWLNTAFLAYYTATGPWLSDPLDTDEEGEEWPITVSLLNTAHSSELLAAIASLKTEIVQAGKQDATQELLPAALDAFRFHDPDYVDLADLVTNLSRTHWGNTTSEKMALWQNLQTALMHTVTDHQKGPITVRTNGLSIWMPPYLLPFEEGMPVYKTLRFQQKTGWAYAVRHIVQHAKQSPD